MSPKVKFFLLVAGGVILRALIIFWILKYRENPDILRWRDWGRISFLYGLSSTYEADHLAFGTYPNNMPPGTLYIVSLVYLIWIQTGKLIHLITASPAGSLQWVNGVLLTLMLRLPSLIADVALVFLIYFGFGFKKSWPLIMAGIFFLNPIVIFNSAFMGQMDSINNLLLVLAVYFLIKKKENLSAISLSCSLLVKFSLIYAVPFMVIAVYYHRRSLKSVARYVLIFTVWTLIATLPVSLNPIGWYAQYLPKNITGEMPFMSNFAFNFWWIINKSYIRNGNPDTLFSFSEIRLVNSPEVTAKYLFMPGGHLAILIYFLLIIPVFMVFIRKGPGTKDKPNIFRMLALVSLLSFLFLPKMHDRYLYPYFILSLLGLEKPDKTEITAYTLLTIINLSNLILVWHPVYILHFLVADSKWWGWICSALTICIFGLIYNSYITKNEK